jgi:hypothetical protein
MDQRPQILQNGISHPLYRSTTMWAALAILVVSLSVYWFIDLNIAFEIINAVAMATSLGVAVAWLPLAVHSIRRSLHELRSDDALFIGVELLAFNGFIIFTLLWIYRLTESPYWRDHEIAFVARVGIALGFMLFLAASRAIDGEIPPKSYLRVGAYVAGGVIVAVILITLGYHRTEIASSI